MNSVNKMKPTPPVIDINVRSSTPPNIDRKAVVSSFESSKGYYSFEEVNPELLGDEEKELYKKAGLNVIQGQNPTIQAWGKLLREHGPLSITVDSEPPQGTIHALVVIGLKGDGSASGTKVTYIEPANGGTFSVLFKKFLTLYEGSSNWPLQIIYW